MSPAEVRRTALGDMHAAIDGWAAAHASPESGGNAVFTPAERTEIQEAMAQAEARVARGAERSN